MKHPRESPHAGVFVGSPLADALALASELPTSNFNCIDPPMPTLDAALVTLHERLGVPGNYALSRGLKRQCEPPITDLERVADGSGREVMLVGPAATAWRQMRAAASLDQIVLLPLSGFRSIARQTEIIEAKLAQGLDIQTILVVNAAPGYSEHHTGRAIDIGTPLSPGLEQAFADTPAFAWLTANAKFFAFTLSYPPDNPHGVIYEPWHWCWQR